MSEFNDKDKNIMDNEVVDEKTLPRAEDMSEEELYRILKEDADSVEPPSSLSPAAIEEKLKGITQRSHGKRIGIGFVAGIAACLALGIMAGIITYSLIGKPSKQEASDLDYTVVADNGDGSGKPDEVTAPQSTDDSFVHDGYEEVCEIINRYNENKAEIEEKGYIKYESSDMAIPEEVPAAEEYAPADNASEDTDIGSASDSSGMANSAPDQGTTGDYSRTDEQVQGVEEGDIVKTDGKYIYTVEQTTFGVTIHLIEPNGNNSKEIGSIELKDMDCFELYIYGTKIIAIGTAWGDGQGMVYKTYDLEYERIDGDTAASDDVSAEDSRIKTTISIIDISDPTSPKEIKSHTQSGSFNTSRLRDGYLYTFTEDSYYSTTPYEKSKPESYIPTADGSTVTPDRIKRAGDDDTNNYMVMTSIDLASPESFTDTMAVLGGGATYYVSTENIYISRIPDNYYSMGNDTVKTTLSKFSYKNGHMEKIADAKFRGVISDSYYMHEYQGNLNFLYTSFDFRTGETVNGLCIVDEKLEKLGELRNIARGEQIYASYYMDNMAYFVTYRNTDPVFAVDISDPTKPEYKSELKLPGYSEYLHSLGDDTLIGIGYGAAKNSDWDDTTKISLMEIGEDHVVKELSKTMMEQASTNIAGVNHKAVFIDEERGLIGFGLSNGFSDDDPNAYYTEDENYITDRYVVYKRKGDKLVQVLNTVDDKELPVVPMSTLRGVRIGETFYVCSEAGVMKAYKIGDGTKKWKSA